MAVAPTLVAGKLKEAILADMAGDLQPYVDDAQDAAETAEYWGAAAIAQTPLIGLFSAIGTKTIPNTINVVQSIGHTSNGIGAGVYISDATATSGLAASHPNFCKVTQNGRYFRLIADVRGAITAEQGGCPAYVAGVNQRDYLQATLEYAAAVGIKEVVFTQPHYELWAPVRAAGYSKKDWQGNYLIIKENMTLRGLGPSRTLLTMLNSLGGTNDTITQPSYTFSDGGNANGVNDWIGTAIYVYPNTTMDYVTVEDIEVDGTRTYTAGVTTPTNANWSQKGFRIQDRTCSYPTLKNVVMRNISGEIYYTGGGQVITHEHLEDCVFENSAQCVFNPGTAARGTYLNVWAGNSYQIEVVCGAGKFFGPGCRFYNLTSAAILGGAGGGATGFASGYHYSYPLRETDKEPPWTDWGDVKFVNVTNPVVMGSWQRGKITLVDASLGVSTTYGKCDGVDLDVLAIADRRNNYDAVSINGPQNLTTQVPNCPVGVYYEPMRNVAIRLVCGRTKNAEDNSYATNGGRIYSALYSGPTTSFSIDGVASRPYDRINSVPASFVWPTVEIKPTYRSVSTSLYFAYNGAFPSADFTFVPWPSSVNYINPQASGTFTMTLDTSVAFQHNQRMRIVHASTTTGRMIRLPATGSGMSLPEDRILYIGGDYIDLIYNAVSSVWEEATYVTRQKLAFSGSTTITPQQDITTLSSYTFNITVTGAALTDRVTGLAWSAALPSGLVVSHVVSATNTVRVTVYNPTGGTLSIANNTVATAFVRKVT